MASFERTYSLNSPNWLDYRDLIAENQDAYRQSAEMFYAQSWLLSHYIMSSQENRQRFKAFLEAYNSGTPPQEAFKASFGFPSEELNKILKPYLRKMNALIYTSDDMPVPEVSVSHLPASAKRLLLWDAAIKAGHGEDKPYIDLIRSEAARYPQDDYARLVLARAENELGDPTKAIPVLQSYLTSHPHDSEAQFLLGQSYYRLNSNKVFLPGETRDSQLNKSRIAFSNAYKIDPLNAPNLYYLAKAQIEFAGPRNTVALNSALQAHYLRPSVVSYALLAAQLLIINERLLEARDILYQMANDPHQTGQAKIAKTVIEAIDANLSQQDIMKGFEPSDSD